MELYRSKTGEVLSKSEWEEVLNNFWRCFEGSMLCGDIAYKMPVRPADAWDRFSRVVGLTKL